MVKHTGVHDAADIYDAQAMMTMIIITIIIIIIIIISSSGQQHWLKWTGSLYWVTQSNLSP